MANTAAEFFRIRNMHRQLCRTDIFALAKVLNYPDICPEVHQPIVDILPKLPGGKDVEIAPGVFEYKPYKEVWQMPGPREFLVLYPRGHLKTTLISQTYLIQCILNWPDIRILLSCATGDQVERVVRAIRGVFQYNDDFRTLFPEFCPQNADEFGSSQQFVTPARKIMRGEPTVFSVTVGKTIAGYHPDMIFHSDLVDKENVKTPGGINDVLNHFDFMEPLLERYTARDGYPASRGFTFVEGTPYDFGDLHNKLMADKTWTKVIRAAQEDYPFGKILWPSRFPQEELDRLCRKNQWLFCTPYESPVLMADASFKPIGDVQIGDIVLGWDDNENRPKLRKSKVLDKGCIDDADVEEIIMESGRKIICTPDHLWLNGWSRKNRPNNNHKRYSRVHPYGARGLGKSLKSLAFVDFPDNENLNYSQSNIANYLAGVYDGEGSLTSKVTLNFTQTNGKNATVCKKISDSLNALGFSYKSFHRKAKKEKWSDTTLFQLHGGYRNVFRFMRMCNPARRQEIINKLLPHTARFCKRDNVSSVKMIGRRKVYWLTTETGNYVVWGYASKNSAQYLMKCVPQGDGLCDPKDVAFIKPEILGSLVPTLRMHATIDLAGMEVGRTGDYTVLTVGGFDRDGRLYIIDIRRGHFPPEEVIAHIFNIHALYPQIIDFKIEKDAHARVLLPFLQREMSKLQRFPIMVPLKRDTHKSKQERIRALRPWFKTGIIRFNDGIKESTKLELLSEIGKFPSQSFGVHDDILDTLADMMQNSEGGITDDVVADAPDMKFAFFGKPKPQDKFLGFGEGGVAEWLYGPDAPFGGKISKTGFLD